MKKFTVCSKHQRFSKLEKILKRPFSVMSMLTMVIERPFEGLEKKLRARSRRPDLVKYLMRAVSLKYLRNTMRALKQNKLSHMTQMKDYNLIVRQR